MSTDPYVDAVAAKVTALPPSDRTDALADLASLVAELRSTGADEESVRTALGTPQEYADQLLAALTPEPAPANDPQTTVLGVPVDLRGPVDARVRSRIWDPTNPSILVPRLMGAGWSVNLGAVAVRLHLLRPDDEDAQTLAHVPPAAVLAARAVPVVISATTLGFLAARYRGLPRRVPIGWTLTGTPNQWADRRSLLAVAALGAGPAIWTQLPSVPTQDRLVRAARATSMSILSAAAISAAITPPEAPAARRIGAGTTAALPVAGVAAFLNLYLPIRLGLRAQWREASAPTPEGASS